MDFVATYNLVFLKVSNRTGLGIAKVFKAIMNSMEVNREPLPGRGNSLGNTGLLKSMER